MRRNQFVVCLTVLGGLIAGGLLWSYLSRPARLNVLLITLDTTRADRLGCYGARDAETPVLDALAKHGILFQRAYTPVPLTLPSHTGMFTGLQPPEHGVRLNGTYRLEDGIPTLAEQLTAQGYRSGAFVGAYVLHRQFGLSRGFEIYDDDLSKQLAASGPADHAPDDGHDHHERPGASVVESALGWLKKSSGKPFFCWVHLFDPHLPYLPHEDQFGTKFQDRPYDGEIAYVDRQVGRLIEYLEKTGQTERTLVIIAGDHGESLGEHQEQTHGYTLYNATLHVPLIFACPKVWSKSQRVTEVVSLVDLSPSILEIVGVRPVTAFTGRSLAAACRGERLAPVACYLETRQPVEEGHWSPQFGLVTDEWKYIRSPRPELYNLHDDPQELTNLASLNVAQLEEFESQLVEREAALVPRDAPRAALSAGAHRKLASLGYAAGNTSPVAGNETGADIKDRIANYNQFISAVRLLKLGQLEQAEKELQAVIKAVPDYFKAQFNLGVCQMRQKRFAEAAKSFERAIAIDPNPTVLISLAKAHLSLRQPAKAIAPLQQALQLEPESHEAQFLLDDAEQQRSVGN